MRHMPAGVLLHAGIHAASRVPPWDVLPQGVAGPGNMPGGILLPWGHPRPCPVRGRHVLCHRVPLEANVRHGVLLPVYCHCAAAMHRNQLLPRWIRRASAVPCGKILPGKHVHAARVPLGVLLQCVCRGAGCLPGHDIVHKQRRVRRGVRLRGKYVRLGVSLHRLPGRGVQPAGVPELQRLFLRRRIQAQRKQVHRMRDVRVLPGGSVQGLSCGVRVHSEVVRALPGWKLLPGRHNRRGAAAAGLPARGRVPAGIADAKQLRRGVLLPGEHVGADHLPRGVFLPGINSKACAMPRGSPVHCGVAAR